MTILAVKNKELKPIGFSRAGFLCCNDCAAADIEAISVELRERRTFKLYKGDISAAVCDFCGHLLKPADTV